MRRGQGMLRRRLSDSCRHLRFRTRPLRQTGPNLQRWAALYLSGVDDREDAMRYSSAYHPDHLRELHVRPAMHRPIRTGRVLLNVLRRSWWVRRSLYGVNLRVPRVNQSTRGTR
jgi:hypothetical protein